MLSMTGFGRAVAEENGVTLTVEIKTVNNRYLDINLKCPRILSCEEEGIRGVVREKITRGHADVFVSITDKREKPKNLYLDAGAAKAYVSAAEEIKKLFPDIGYDITVSGVLRFPDVLKSEEETAPDELVSALLNRALGEALFRLNVMRKAEGDKLAADMLSRMDEIERLTCAVEERAPKVAETYREKLAARVEKALGDAEIDEARILSEVAVFTDKCNIDEELTRLKSHISQFREICKEDIVGRKLDFLVQEFNRETNTVCSKSNDLEVTRLGLALKNEIEKVREQVQNVE